MLSFLTLVACRGDGQAVGLAAVCGWSWSSIGRVGSSVWFVAFGFGQFCFDQYDSAEHWIIISFKSLRQLPLDCQKHTHGHWQTST